jgi:hypothetical protein
MPEPGTGKCCTRNLLKDQPFFVKFQACGVGSDCVTISTLAYDCTAAQKRPYYPNFRYIDSPSAYWSYGG